MKTRLLPLVPVLLGLALVTQSARAQFTFLAPGFVQELVVTSPGFNVAGVALGQNGFLFTNDAGGNTIGKWDSANRTAINGSSIYTLASSATGVAASNWGMTVDTSGALYSLGSSGLYSINQTTLAGTFVGPAGIYGLAYAASTDAFYSSNGSQIIRTNRNGTSSVLASNAIFIDQVGIDPTGQFVAGALLGGAGSVAIWNINTGALVGTFNTGGHLPDGLAFDSSGNVFTNNTDGTVTRLNFNAGNYAGGLQSVTLIASGGFYGDLAGVGSDGAFYLSQYGTRFANGVTNGDASIVRLTVAGGGGFVDGGGGGTAVGAVPEPSTYGLLGAAALMGAVVYRRRLSARKA